MYPNMIEKYEIFLFSLTNLLQKYFESQKEYIKCRIGCSRCCEIGEYPFSQLEFDYAMLAFKVLPDEVKSIIKKQACEVINAKKSFKPSSSDDKFKHRCPFLVGNKCSIYSYRGIVCRTHGLIYYKREENGQSRNIAPECMTIGLNYHEVYDDKAEMITSELCNSTGYKNQPKTFNLSREAILSTLLIKQLELEFGDNKPIIDFFIDEKL